MVWFTILILLAVETDINAYCTQPNCTAQWKWAIKEHDKSDILQNSTNLIMTSKPLNNFVCVQNKDVSQDIWTRQLKLVLQQCVLQKWCSTLNKLLCTFSAPKMFILLPFLTSLSQYFPTLFLEVHQQYTFWRSSFSDPLIYGLGVFSNEWI